MQSVPQLVQRFITHLQAERSFSDHTARSYGSDLVRYFGFLEKLGTSNSTVLAMEADRTTIAIFIAELKRQHYKGSSIARKIAALRSFYKWMTDQHIIGDNPATRIRSRKFPLQTVKIVTAEQLLALLSMPDTSTFLGARDLAIIQTICSTGIKTDELVRLNQDNVDVNSDSPCIGIGGTKRRTLDLDSASLVALRKYLELRTAIKSQDPVPFFINKHGTRISGRSIRRKIDKYLEMADIDPAITPRILRHTYAQHLIGNGTDVEEVGRLLGNRSTQTVILTYAGFSKQTQEA